MMPQPRQINDHWVFGVVAFIDVSTKRHPCRVALIDAVDLPLVIDGGGRWHAHNAGRGQLYVIRKIARTSLHRLLCPTALLVDHRDGDTFDNRRHNLRPATPSQNRMNSKAFRTSTSKYKGVCFDKASSGWSAQLRHSDVTYHLGIYPTERDAARVYDKMALVFFGSFACLNFGADRAAHL